METLRSGFGYEFVTIILLTVLAAMSAIARRRAISKMEAPRSGFDYELVTIILLALLAVLLLVRP